MDLPKRKHIRLQQYDYSQNGLYFITICSYQRHSIFGTIPVGQELHLSRIGQIINKEINDLTSRFQNVCIDNYVIMPNHIHLLVTIDGKEQGQSPTISNVIGVLKSITTKQANTDDHTPNRKIWQFRFHDHIVRSDNDYKRIWQYIDSNPYKWSEDCYFSLD